jgi:cytoskeletal protein CcmA (bactofilin family)
MTDGFLATVDSYDEAENTATVSPLVAELDGTPHPQIKVKPVAGIKPASGDTVLVVTIRNNLNDEEVSRYFAASESNGRIIHVVKPAGGVFTFKGDYKFIGDVVFDGNVEVTGDTTLDGDLTVKGDAEVEGDTTLDGDLTVKGDAEVQGSLDVQQSATIAANAVVTGNLSVGGLQSATPGSPASVIGNLEVTGNLTVNGTAFLTGIYFGSHRHDYLGPVGPAVTGGPIP